jgi:hypothetical protein
MRTGKIKVQIDTAEHECMEGLFKNVNEYLGGILEIERTTLNVGDYILKVEGYEPFVVTFKELSDFRQSFFSGHLMEEILAIQLKYPNSSTALIIARDDQKRTPQEIHIWVDQHWQKRNFIIPTFKFGSRQKAVEFMVDCAMKIDSLQTIPRRVQRPEDYSQVVGLYSFYGVGIEKAKQLAEKYPKPFDLFADMASGYDYDECKEALAPVERLTKKKWREGRWWYGILGETTAVRIEDMILHGREIPKKSRSRDD